MLGWFWRMFRRDRAIYEYFNGTKTVRIDPMKAIAKLEEVLPDHEAQFATLRESLDGPPVGVLRDELISQKRDAIKKLTDASRVIFGLAPLGSTSGGVTDGEAIAILAGFANFMAVLAERAALFQHSPQVG